MRTSAAADGNKGDALPKTAIDVNAPQWGLPSDLARQAPRLGLTGSAKRERQATAPLSSPGGTRSCRITGPDSPTCRLPSLPVAPVPSRSPDHPSHSSREHQCPSRGLARVAHSQPTQKARMLGISIKHDPPPSGQDLECLQRTLRSSSLSNVISSHLAHLLSFPPRTA